jgi:hypothetical protein
MTGTQVHLPALEGVEASGCDTWIVIQNVGSEPTKAALVVFREPGVCGAGCSGPHAVECTGLIAPGSAWYVIGNQSSGGDHLLVGARSASLFSFTARSFNEVFPETPFAICDLVADVMCETLSFGVVGDCADYAAFKAAFDQGGAFAGIPQDRAAGAPLAVEVQRTCSDDAPRTDPKLAIYSGVTGSALGGPAASGEFAYAAPLVLADRSGVTSLLHFQNAGSDCATVEVWLHDSNDCASVLRCDVLSIAPGERRTLDPTSCAGQEWEGSSVVRSDQPLALVVDTDGLGGRWSYSGVAVPVVGAGVDSVTAPLTFGEQFGWDAGIQVQNLDSALAADMLVTFRDATGNVVATFEDSVCPLGSRSFVLPATDYETGRSVGSVRAEVRDWQDGSGARRDGVGIAAVAQLARHGASERRDPEEAVVYSLVSLPNRASALAVPFLGYDPYELGIHATELAVTNLVSVPGFTRYVMYLYDGNGLVDYSCWESDSEHVDYIDLADSGLIDSGFLGTAVVSPIYWEHAVFDPAGSQVANPVGLGLLSVHRGPADPETGSGRVLTAKNAAPFRMPRGFTDVPLDSWLCPVPYPPWQPTSPPTVTPPVTPTQPPTRPPPPTQTPLSRPTSIHLPVAINGR